MFVCESGSVRRLVDLHQREHLLTQICAPEHAQDTGTQKAELWHCAWDECSNVAFSGPLHCSSISSNCKLSGTLSTSIVKGFVKRSNLNFWVSKSENRLSNSALSVFSFSAHLSFGKAVLRLSATD